MTARIDVAELRRMARAGVTRRECAEHFGVSAAAITMAAQRSEITYFVDGRSTPAFREAQSRRMKALHADPVYSAKTLAVLQANARRARAAKDFWK